MKTLVPGLSRCVVVISLLLGPALHAELKLPAIISDHMVLQQKQSDPIWGWDAPGTKVTVTGKMMKEANAKEKKEGRDHLNVTNVKMISTSCQ